MIIKDKHGVKQWQNMNILLAEDCYSMSLINWFRQNLGQCQKGMLDFFNILLIVALSR